MLAIFAGGNVALLDDCDRVADGDSAQRMNERSKGVVGSMSRRWKSRSSGESAARIGLGSWRIVVS